MHAQFTDVYVFIILTVLSYFTIKIAKLTFPSTNTETVRDAHITTPTVTNHTPPATIKITHKKSGFQNKIKLYSSVI